MYKKYWLSALLALLAGGCALTPEHSAYQDDIQPELDATTDETQISLLDLVNVPPIDELVARALVNSPSLRQVELTLQSLSLQAQVANGERLPAIDAAVGKSREQDADTLDSSSVTVSWTLDVWGQLADNARAAELDVEQQQRLYEDARNLLVAQVIQSWINLISSERVIDIQQRQLKILESITVFTQSRFRSGLGSLEDLDTAQTNVASSRATLASAQLDRTQAISELKVLLGTDDQPLPVVEASYPDVSLPASALHKVTPWRRPDLQAAYYAVAAADARTRVSYKALLPTIDLQLALSSADSLVLADPVWSLLAQLTAPIYRGGALRAEAEATELEAAQAYEAYRETLLSATEEIALTLAKESSYAEQVGHIHLALAKAEENVLRYRQNYREGLVDLLDLLAIEQQRFELESQLNELLSQQLGNRIDIGLALGLGVDRA